jgi:hypothetical protein
LTEAGLVLDEVMRRRNGSRAREPTGSALKLGAEFADLPQPLGLSASRRTAGSPSDEALASLFHGKISMCPEALAD